MPPTSNTSDRQPPGELPQVRANVELIATQAHTTEALYIVPRCALCGGKHRHRTDGVRVSGCRRGLYRVVAA